MKLKTNCHFTKWDGLNIVFVIQCFWCLRIYEALQIFFYKFFLKWGKNEDFETLWKSSLKMITLFRRCSIQLWNIKRGFNVVERCKFQHWRTQHCFNIDLMLCNVATSYQPKNNVEPTLKCLLDWSCLKQINLYKILWK